MAEQLKTKEEIITWLKEMNIHHYNIHEDLTVDVDDDVDLNKKFLVVLPIQFGIVKGFFNCSMNYLISLKGSPKKVEGHFECSFNKLTSLEYCPEAIEGSFSCNNNLITSLKGCPKVIKGYLDCTNNQLESLEGIAEIIGDSLYMKSTSVISLKNFTSKIGRNIDCSHIKDINYLTLNVGGYFYQRVGCENQLKGLEEYYLDEGKQFRIPMVLLKEYMNKLALNEKLSETLETAEIKQQPKI